LAAIIALMALSELFQALSIFLKSDISVYKDKNYDSTKL